MNGIAICYLEITWDCFPLRVCRLFIGRVRIHLIIIYEIINN